MAATATKKTQPIAPPVSFAEIAERKMRERIEAYRALVQRHATGEVLEAQDYERAAELLEQLHLPDYAFSRDVEAVQRQSRTHRKWVAASESEPINRERAKQLADEVQTLTVKLRALNEQLRIANGAAGKVTAYAHTLTQLAVDHPHLFADIDSAARLRSEEINRRRQMGGAA